ncbi:MAG TPA: sugar phosphate nucleotidyltransferase, partial [Candidatus Dormibacteraeota bacterium]|nr:sugar phosphate nucleotidyltransferase [Candidatus Dormibacteraeota bacterium]
ILSDGDPCLKQLIDAYRKTQATVIAVRRFPRSEIGRYGVVAASATKGRIHEVTDMVEKPERGREPSDLAILGRYVLTPAVFDELDRAEPGSGKEIQLTDAIKSILGRHPVVAFEFEGDYYDTGTVPGYLRANLMLAMKREGLREELEPLLRELLEQSAQTTSRRAQGLA